MDEYVIWIIVIAFILLSLIVTFIIIDFKINKIVLLNSKKIEALESINNEIKFNAVENKFKINKHYDNKSHFNKIEPAYLMSAEIKKDIQFYTDYVNLIRENKEKHIEYRERTRNISNMIYEINYKELKVPEWIYKRVENKIFKKKIIKPVLNCKIEVTMTYSSPKGKVNLSKEGTFNFNDLFTCLESVSRTYLDKKTYKNLTLVERGDVSDSLRYDVLLRDNFTCVICGASNKQGVRLHVDHIIPVSKGGKSNISNLRTLCERCNVGKSNKIETTDTLNDSCDNNDPVCKLCGSKLVMKNGKYGSFLGCSNFPKCKYTENV